MYRNPNFNFCFISGDRKVIHVQISASGFSRLLVHNSFKTFPILRIYVDDYETLEVKCCVGHESPNELDSSFVDECELLQEGVRVRPRFCLGFKDSDAEIFPAQRSS